jgi:hypothetical protein
MNDRKHIRRMSIYLSNEDSNSEINSQELKHHNKHQSLN